MSFLTENGITMASDSKVTYFPGFRIDNNLDFKKTNYFDDLNFGLSIWGKLKIKKDWFWKWFGNIKKIYFKEKSSELNKFPDYLADKLNVLNMQIDTGIHLAFYKEFENQMRPVIYHITNKRLNKEFIAQPDCNPLYYNKSFLLINGTYEPFSDAYTFLEKYISKVRNKFLEAKQDHPNLLETNRTSKSKLKKECEYVISTIRQYQAIMEMTGVKKIIGEPINAICFNKEGLVKEYSKIHFF
ncbi:hypothetical protein LCGC14_0606880 [marine sediment metagenome]|uniref:Uncharacterized protein n=1 Tax=marine sediment metagenome TaxID=412755 RepID=A0A0F9RDP7_9ZZZZ